MTCATCRHRKARRVCACCQWPTCAQCAEEIGGLTHCPDCASDAREFINAAPLEVNDRAAQVPRDGQIVLPRPA